MANLETILQTIAALAEAQGITFYVIGQRLPSPQAENLMTTNGMIVERVNNPIIADLSGREGIVTAITRSELKPAWPKIRDQSNILWIINFGPQNGEFLDGETPSCQENIVFELVRQEKIVDVDTVETVQIYKRRLIKIP